MQDEITVLILKPDCVRKGHCGEVISRLEKLGLKIVAVRFEELDTQVIRQHYIHLRREPFYEELVEFMKSGPSMVIAWRALNAVAIVRKLLGPTNCNEAPLGTIRGDFGEKDNRAKASMYNIAHASDSIESAAVEWTRFFESKI